MSVSTLNSAIRFGMVTTCFFFTAAGIALADGGSAGGTVDAQPNPPSKASENYYKTGKFLPGEEVISPTGKKIKVWSTTGPVSVSPPPQPFDEPGQQINGSQIIVDGTSGYRHRPNADQAPDTRYESNDRPRGEGTGDTFQRRDGNSIINNQLNSMTPDLENEPE